MDTRAVVVTQLTVTNILDQSIPVFVATGPDTEAMAATSPADQAIKLQRQSRSMCVAALMLLGSRVSSASLVFVLETQLHCCTHQHFAPGTSLEVTLVHTFAMMALCRTGSACAVWSESRSS